MDFIGKKWEQKMERWFYFDIDWGKLLLLKGQQKNFEKMMEPELLRELLVIMNILQNTFSKCIRCSVTCIDFAFDWNRVHFTFRCYWKQ